MCVRERDLGPGPPCALPHKRAGTETAQGGAWLPPPPSGKQKRCRHAGELSTTSASAVRQQGHRRIGLPFRSPKDIPLGAHRSPQPSSVDLQKQPTWRQLALQKQSGGPPAAAPHNSLEHPRATCGSTAVLRGRHALSCRGEEAVLRTGRGLGRGGLRGEGWQGGELPNSRGFGSPGCLLSRGALGTHPGGTPFLGQRSGSLTPTSGIPAPGSLSEQETSWQTLFH